MKAVLLLENLSRVVDAVDAIPRIRRFIFDLAVRGRLAEQHRTDGSALELINRIAKLNARRGAPNGKAGSPVESDEIPFHLPKLWIWTRLGNITSYIQRGKSPKYATADGATVVSQKCVQWRGLDLDLARKITFESLAEYDQVRFIRDGDLLWNSTGTGTIGRIVRVSKPPERLVCDSHVTVVRCLECSSEYVRTWLRSDHVYGRIEGRASGSTNQVELTAQMARDQIVPLPPLDEQHRIVTRIQELMALCDRMEAGIREQGAIRGRLLDALLNQALND